MTMLIFWSIWLSLFLVVESIKKDFNRVQYLTETSKKLNQKMKSLRIEIKELKKELN